MKLHRRTLLSFFPSIVHHPVKLEKRSGKPTMESNACNSANVIATKGFSKSQKPLAACNES
jgi:hypothetical protein